MNIFDFAMQMEKDGENYYRELAHMNNSKGLSNILTMLADEEVKHYETIKLMKKKTLSIAESDILQSVKNIFVQMKERNEKIGEGLQKEVYKKAQELEKKSEDFYAKQSRETSDNAKKDIFLKLALEEKKHYFILENIIEFIMRPETWLEDAEFNHLDEY